MFSLCWFDSPEEAGRYLETYKSYEKKPADLLKEQVEKDYLSKVGWFILFYLKILMSVAIFFIVTVFPHARHFNLPKSCGGF